MSTKPAAKGKNSAKKRNFRRRSGQQQMDATDPRRDARLGSLSQDEYSSLASALARLGQRVQCRQLAIPLTVTTRGVGVATAIAYDHAATTWDVENIRTILTIHQMYRVHLWLVYYKVYLAQKALVVPLTSFTALEHIFIAHDFSDTIRRITEAPSMIVMILDCIGKIETQDNIYHMGFGRAQNETLEYRCLVQTPVNLRATLDMLAAADTPEADRQAFIAANSIPGARYENNLLQNAEQIMPINYGLQDLVRDIHSYQNLLARAHCLLPKQYLAKFEWSATGNAGGLWSTELADLRVSSRFDAGRAPLVAGSRRRLRGNDDEIVDVSVPAIANADYRSSEIVGSQFSTFWSREPSTSLATAIGCTSLVGEYCHVSTRHRMTGPNIVTTDPVGTMMVVTHWVGGYDDVDIIRRALDRFGETLPSRLD
ncbi:uncharacterized protein LOC128277063 [Anopheles cruzii]|uniref:uncharacterized protein LOC128274645 n=1 Tax=Anopheles cruzii TaxID=68878 RepID=UPI0022EC1E8A|nr:uncharacterized protein LOC128274645 [Anopheles cruzii]XP_052871473.1 uncharacterized protein LOC128277063 [Anopheles cruzii]